MARPELTQDATEARIAALESPKGAKWARRCARCPSSVLRPWGLPDGATEIRR